MSNRCVVVTVANLVDGVLRTYPPYAKILLKNKLIKGVFNYEDIN